MDKIAFTFSDTEEKVEFFVLEQTKFQGCQYLLVADSEEEEGETEAYILKDLSDSTDTDAIYEMVDDDRELAAVSQIFAELMEDVSFEMDDEE